MKVLHILAQKPSETGSGIYFKNIVENFKQLGHEQAVIYGKESFEEFIFTGVKSYSVCFSSEKMPFKVVGMSDVMPYDSTRYRDLTINNTEIFMKEFQIKILEANKEFEPDVIICHHLYLITALTVSLIKNKRIYGVCHGTDLRQINSNNLMNKFIIENIRKLHGIFALHSKCKDDVIKTFNIEDEKVFVSGVGYNQEIFYNENLDKSDEIQIVYTGKISFSKGLKPLYYSFNKICDTYKNVTLNLVGMGAGSEYEEIKKLYKNSKGKVEFLGKLSQVELALLYNKSDIFILPSFYEGLPLVLVEALATGLSVVTSNIIGVSTWLGECINKSGKIKYVDLPRMKNVDEPLEIDVEKYVNKLCEAMEESIELCKDKDKINIDTSKLTWSNLANRMSRYIDIEEI